MYASHTMGYLVPMALLIRLYDISFILFLKFRAKVQCKSDILKFFIRIKLLLKPFFYKLEALVGIVKPVD